MQRCHLALALCAVVGLVAGQPPVGYHRYSPGYDGMYSPGYGHTPGTVVRTHRTSAADEVKSAAVRALVGLVVFILAFPVLWFNEQRAAKMWKLFGRAAKMARSNVGSDIVNPEFDGRLVHMTSVTSTKEVLRDSITDISVTDCAKLRRNVQMYQWVENEQTEERDTRDGGKEKTTTYTYQMEWRSEGVDSSSFQNRSYENPPMPFHSESWQVTALSFGAFRIPPTLIGRLRKWSNVESGGPVSLDIKGVGKPFSQTGPGRYSTMGNAQPALGDMQISMDRVPCGDATVLALQDGESFAPLEFATEVAIDGRAIRAEGNKEPFLKKGGGDEEDLMSSNQVGCCGAIGQLVEANEEVFAIAEKRMSLKEIFTSVRQQESGFHLLLQILGFIMLVGGLDYLFQVVPAIFRFIPFIGTWIQFFGNLVVHVAAFLLGSFCWLITVALAWLWARPVKAVILIVIAGLCVAVPTMLASQQS